MASEVKTVRVRITGVVQGVGFRAWARSQSHAFGLAGWVRNEPDGSVSALVQGEAEKVDSMLERLRRGPPGAAVSGLETAEEDEAGRLHAFDVLS